jgi:hypothetical protein
MNRRLSNTTFGSLMTSGHTTLPGQGPIVPYPIPPTPVLEKMYDLVELGRYLRLGPRPLMRAISEGRLTSSFVGRQHLVSESSIASYLEGQKGTSPYGKKPHPETQDAETK